MRNDKLLEYALESLGKGISVIPVGKNKIPLVPWKEYQERHATPEEVTSWFDKFDDPQIGFVTGKISNLTVVDVEKGGDPSFLPQDTMIVSTGGGGYHYFFNFEEGVNNKARIKELVDIRGEGGYVVSPNSVSEKGSYAIVQEKSWSKFPKGLFPSNKGVDIFQTPAMARSTQQSGLQSYPGFGQGQRNDEIARYIGYLLTQIHPADWDTVGWTATVEANLRNTPPLPPNELLTTWNSIKDTERRNNPLGRGVGQFSAPNRPPQGVPEEPIIIENDEIKHLAEVAEEQGIDPSEVYPLQMKCFDEAILGGVCAGDIVVIAGQTSHGKTTLAQDWTISLLRGEKKLKALWFSYEVLATHLWTKFQEMGVSREDCIFIPAKHSTGNVDWVEAKIKEGKEKFGIKAVFIDHLGFLLPKTNGILGKNLSSNYAAFITQIMRDLKTIALKEEVIIFLPVHMKKVESGRKYVDINDIKDSSGVGQEADLVFIIERERDRSDDARSYFTDVTKITLAKNRKTGITVIGNFSMIDGRFAYDEQSAKEIDDFYSNYKEVKVEGTVEKT